MNEQMKHILTEKEARRRRLAALPFAEKIRALVRLQAMAAPIQRSKRKRVRVWPVAPEK